MTLEEVLGLSWSIGEHAATSLKGDNKGTDYFF
jgi:hypothetical protein